MILYHGSNVEVKEPILLKVQRELDFGKGFYTTSDMEQAARWAWRTAKRRGESNAFVTVYEVNEDELKNIRLLSFYIDTSEEEEEIDIRELSESFRDINREIKESNETLLQMFGELTYSSQDTKEAVEEFVKVFLEG